MLKVFGAIVSGNCYKVKVLLHLLGLEHQWQEVDLVNGGARTEEFLIMNPNGKTPTLQIDENTFLAESNAILYYLAQNTQYFPQDTIEQAQVMQWMFFEQYSHEPYIATSRFIHMFLELTPERLADLESKKVLGEKALFVMEKQLEDHAFIAGNSFTIADISLYAYTHVAEDGGFDLSSYPNVLKWIKRVELVENFKPMKGFL
ncbi:MAG: glutathione S-transferase family protein [Kangiellaceae bacterium]|nr:glutathione S-transferase family protein [Kangiellaceae bacterium]